jgi:hypothetical protein
MNGRPSTLLDVTAGSVLNDYDYDRVAALLRGEGVPASKMMPWISVFGC